MLDAQPANFQREKAQSIMEAYITRFGDKIDGVCANDDDMALGALAAINAAIKAGRLGRLDAFTLNSKVSTHALARRATRQA